MHLTTYDKRMVLLIRSIHGAITLFFLSCIAYIYYAALTDQQTVVGYAAIGLILIEGCVVLLNDGDCPLGTVHKKYGDEKDFFELFMPKRFSKRAIPVLSIVSVVGMLMFIF